uniref:Uncharacterized protein n=2 Tax=Anguilla anguilla TaxID=7936 RepID=A0A0E9QF45_ANGAN
MYSCITVRRAISLLCNSMKGKTTLLVINGINSHYHWVFQGMSFPSCSIPCPL